MNNDVSSLKVSAGYKVTIYDLDNFSGSSWVFTADDNSLIDNGCNDKMSSVKIESIPTMPGTRLLWRRVIIPPPSWWLPESLIMTSLP